MEESTIRLNKSLANLGLCARRDVKQFLKDHTITVNGVRAKEQGIRIYPNTDVVKIDGTRLEPPKLVYFLLNKPKGYISTTADEFGRKNVLTLIDYSERLYPVGRLDKDTTGIILLTNDGELTNHLTHPRYHVNKVYRVTAASPITKEQLRALRNGVLLDDGITYPAEVKIVKEYEGKILFDITIHEGRNRQIRRMCETVGIKLIDLQRISFGPLQLGNLKLGKYRELSNKEVQNLKTSPENK